MTQGGLGDFSFSISKRQVQGRDFILRGCLQGSAQFQSPLFFVASKETKDEMIGWHHRPNGREFEQALGDGEGQGSLACFSSLCCKELDMTEQLNNNKCPSNRTPRE